MNTPTPHPLEEPNRSSRTMDPCVLVIFGATGDLTGRKLTPALYNLGREGMLPPNFATVGFARREKTHEEYRAEVKKDVSTYSRVKPIDETFWKNFEQQIFYHKSEFDDDAGYVALDALLKELDTKFATRGNRVFYLSVQPKYFPVIIQKLKTHGLIYNHHDKEKWSRVIIEKPFGHDSASAEELQKEISQYLDESQTYRIDHYLGKETVQNLLVFRFANSIFESIWNYKHIDHVQITVAEEIGIGTRGHFYEEEGLLRDILQNHMMQLLSLVAMEPPVSLSGSCIRDEKVKVIQSIRPLSEDDFQNTVIRGQYGSGLINGNDVISYRQEKDVNPNSNVETYLALRLFIDNWRWAGVPFYLRGGKRLPKEEPKLPSSLKMLPVFYFSREENGMIPISSPSAFNLMKASHLKLTVKFQGQVPLSSL